MKVWIEHSSAVKVPADLSEALKDAVAKKFTKLGNAAQGEQSVDAAGHTCTGTIRITGVRDVTFQVNTVAKAKEAPKKEAAPKKTAPAKAAPKKAAAKK